MTKASWRVWFLRAWMAVASPAPLHGRDIAKGRMLVVAVVPVDEIGIPGAGLFKRLEKGKRQFLHTHLALEPPHGDG